MDLNLEGTDNRWAIRVIPIGKYPIREGRMEITDWNKVTSKIESAKLEAHFSQSWDQAMTQSFFDRVVGKALPESTTKIELGSFTGREEWLGDFSPTIITENLISPPVGLNDNFSLTINFSSLNGFWQERFSAMRLNGKWFRAIRIDDKEHPFEKVDPGYPEINGTPFGWPIKSAKQP